MRFAFRSFLLTLLGVCAAQATPPTPPATIHIDERSLRAESAVLVLRVEARAGVREIAVKVSVRAIETGKPEFERAAPRVVFEQQIKPGRKQPLIEVPLKGIEPGEYELDVFLTGNAGKNDGFSDRDLRHLTVTKEGYLRIEGMDVYEKRQESERVKNFRSDLADHPKSPRVRLLMGQTATVPQQIADRIKDSDVPENRRQIVRPAPLDADLKGYYIDHSQTSWTSVDPVTVRGRITYLAFDGVWRPLVNVAVDIWDEDTFGDEYLGTTITDWSGNWTMSVNDDDGFLADGRDIYYAFRLANTRLGLSKCSGEYRWSSAVHDDVSDGSVVDFGTETAGSDGNSLIVWAALNKAWNHVTTVGGQDPGAVSACFPASATNTTKQGLVNVAAGDFDGDGITHEYGHAIMFKANGTNPSPGGPHNFGDCNQNQALSWSEGWATGFMLSVLPDNTFNWHFGDMGRNIEANNNGCRTGETAEDWVAAALLDMFDSANDSNGGDQNLGRNSYGDNNSANRIALASMYRDTLWGHSPNNDALQFWYALSGELPQAQRNPGQEVMYYNWMSVLAPDSCVATKVSTAELKDPEPVLAGLRRFRDLALKPVPDGRNLINAYYRNSPEMALLLVKNPGYLGDSLRVLQHFGALGDTIGNNQRYRAATAQDVEVIPADVQKSIDRLFELFGTRGGRTLATDTRGAMKAYESVKSLRWVALQDVATALKAEGAKRPFIYLERGTFSPESRKALQDAALRAVRSKGLPQPPKR
ncbi:MAG TPA: hypothetical protein VK624_11640 [Steroidobacteraceae bacterium]|nr:hypothetical protein [Steroidobacteraceae bacterium]